MSVVAVLAFCVCGPKARKLTMSPFVNLVDCLSVFFKFIKQDLSQSILANKYGIFVIKIIYRRTTTKTFS